MASSLPWAWIIETLADFKQQDSHLLLDFMRAAPDFSIDSCEIARERVSLRILEDMLDLIPANASEAGENGGVHSSSGRNVCIDASEHAVDVLCKVTATNLMHGAELKHGLNQFILQKRACLPKHALEQLKELVLEGSHPSIPSLRERSGLSKENRVHCLDDGIPADSIGEFETTERLKVSNRPGETPTIERNLSTVALEDGNTKLSVGDHNQISRSELVEREREPLLHSKVSIDDEKGQSVELITQPPDESAKMPPEAKLNGAHKTINQHQDLHQSICIDETHDEHSERPASSGSDGGQHTDLNHGLDDEMIAHEKHQFMNSQNTASHNSRGGVWTEQNLCIMCDEGGQLLICSGSSCPIAVHESCLGSPLSFECSSNFYCPFCSYTRAHTAYRKAKQKFAIARKTLSSFMGRDLDHPKQRWKLPAGVHEKPSGTARNSNYPDKIHADRQHREITENHLSKQVSEHQQKEKAFVDWSDNSLHCREPVTSPTCGSNDVPLIQRKEGSDTAVADNQCTTAVEQCHQVEIATECSDGKLPCKEVEMSIIIERHDVSSINVDRNCVEIVKESQCIREAQHLDQVEPSTTCNNDTLPSREAETSLVGVIHNVIHAKGDNELIIDNYQFVNGSTLHKQVENGIDCDTGNTPCMQAKTSPTAKRHSALKRKSAEMQESSHQDNPIHLDAEETDRNQNEEDFSNKRMTRGREKQHKKDFSNKRSTRAVKRYSNPLIPQMRRTKLHWTAEEVEVLKGAVQRFSTPGQVSLPWTRIMEFGSKVFHKTRTPVDLKDKWRNIMIKEGSTPRKKVI